MINLLEMFKVGQKVKFYNSDFDAVKKISDCIVKSVSEDAMIIVDLDTNTNLFIEPGFNLENVFPVTEEGKINLSSMTASEIFTELSDTQKIAIYQIVLEDSISNDTKKILESNKYTKYELDKEQIDNITNNVKNDFIYKNMIDLDMSYLDNLEFLISKALEE